MPDLFPARTVSVVKIFRAHCNLPDCPWNHRNPDAGQRPGEYGTYAEANAERTTHLEWHRMRADDTESRDA